MLRNTKIKGFTLIEVIVATALFSIITIGISNLFVSAMQAQRQIASLQAVQENGRYLMESISKEIRTSRIISDEGTAQVLRIKNAKDEDVEYIFEDKQIKRIVNLDKQVLNSSQIEIVGNFYIKKEEVQPRVTIVMDLDYKSSKPEQKVGINLQTTMSSRAY